MQLYIRMSEVWHGNGIVYVHINEVTLCQAELILTWASICIWCLISQQGRFSLADIRIPATVTTTEGKETASSA